MYVVDFFNIIFNIISGRQKTNFRGVVQYQQSRSNLRKLKKKINDLISVKHIVLKTLKLNNETT